MLKKVLLGLIINSLLGGCMNFEKKNPEGLILYGSIKYENKLKESKIKLEDAEKILCTFIKDKKEFHEYINLYFLYEDSFVFSLHKNQVKTTYKNGANITKGIYGVYINMNTGKLNFIKKNDENDILIVLDTYLDGISKKFTHYLVSCDK